MQESSLIFLFLVFGQLCSFGICRRCLFKDEFSSSLGKWQHLITAWRGGNNEFQYYTDQRENSYVKNGILHITPTFTANQFGNDFLYNGTLNLWEQGCNIDLDGGCWVKAGEEIINPIQSARIRTLNSFSFKYGTVEVRAKMPAGDWIWPAIWLLPTEEVYGGWPRSGEIDMVEVRGNRDLSCNGKQIGNRLMGSALHWGPRWDNNQFHRTVWEKYSDTLSTEFHVYGLRWTSDGIMFLLDGQVVGLMNAPDGGFWRFGQLSGDNIWALGSRMAPFDQKFHLVLNVAVGGNFFPDGCINSAGAKPWDNNSRTKMKSFWEARDKWLPTWGSNPDNYSLQVDYIRVYSD